MFDPDKAIKYCNEDELGRCEFAKSVGNAILNHESEDSLVIGLQGKWGYGKTSIINMALENIKEITKELIYL
ncbi:MAG: P-loop NTPase fold protein [Methanobacterium sp.]